MEPDDPIGPRFEADDETLAKLEVVELQVSPRVTCKRAMQTDLWDELQDRADREAEAATAASPPEPSPIARSAPVRSGTRHNPPLSPAANSAPVDSRSDADLYEVVREWKTVWIRELIAVPPADLAPLHTASITPPVPPQTTVWPRLAISAPTCSASRSASGLALPEPITDMIKGSLFIVTQSHENYIM